MSVARRDFLRHLGGAALAPSLAGLVAACSDTDRLTAPAGPATSRLPRAGRGYGGYGELSVSTDCPELLIPAGFTCVKLSETLAPSRANPAFVVPQAFDGMAAFPVGNGRVRLIRNHEIRDPVSRATPLAPNAYDSRAGGGTTTLEVRILHDGEGDVADVELLQEFVSLSGTHVNCAGGPTPWGSWLSCEETTEGAPQGRLAEPEEISRTRHRQFHRGVDFWRAEVDRVDVEAAAQLAGPFRQFALRDDHAGHRRPHPGIRRATAGQRPVAVAGLSG